MEEDEEFDPIKYERYARLPDVAVDELGRDERFKCDGPEKLEDVDDVWRKKAPELYVNCPPRVSREEAEEKEAKKYEMRLEAEHEAKRIDALFRSLAANPITWPASAAPPALLPAPALLADPALLLAPAPVLTAAAVGAGWSTNLLSPAPTPASSAIVATGYHGDDDDEGEYYDESTNVFAPPVPASVIAPLAFSAAASAPTLSAPAPIPGATVVGFPFPAVAAPAAPTALSLLAPRPPISTADSSVVAYGDQYSDDDEDDEEDDNWGGYKNEASHLVTGMPPAPTGLLPAPAAALPASSAVFPAPAPTPASAPAPNPGVPAAAAPTAIRLTSNRFPAGFQLWITTYRKRNKRFLVGPNYTGGPIQLPPKTFEFQYTLDDDPKRQEGCRWCGCSNWLWDPYFFMRKTNPDGRQDTCNRCVFRSGTKEPTRRQQLNDWLVENQPVMFWLARGDF